jgi:putative transposase
VYYGRAEERLAQRHAVLQAAYAEHPERFPHGLPRPQRLPAATYINPPSVGHAADSNDRLVVGCEHGTLMRDVVQTQ